MTRPSLADELPPELAAMVHPDWRTNEKRYWEVRDSLPAEYGGQWVAFADGAVVSAGRVPVEVSHAAHGRHAFFTFCGAEDTPARRRRATFAYDTSYIGSALPLLAVEFRGARGAPGVLLDRVIPDTGADQTALPVADCDALGLDPTAGKYGRVVGVGGQSVNVLVFNAWVWLDGHEYPCRLQIDLTADDRILGRDVMNQLDILFRGPAGKVVVNP